MCVPFYKFIVCEDDGVESWSDIVHTLLEEPKIRDFRNFFLFTPFVIRFWYDNLRPYLGEGTCLLDFRRKTARGSTFVGPRL